MRKQIILDPQYSPQLYSLSNSASFQSNRWQIPTGPVAHICIILDGKATSGLLGKSLIEQEWARVTPLFLATVPTLPSIGFLVFCMWKSRLSF